MNSSSFISEQEIFEAVRREAQSMTQVEIAAMLHCSQPAVSQMLAGDPNMMSLALRFLQKTDSRLQLQLNNDGKPVRYFKKIE